MRHELYNLKFIKVKQNPDEYWIFLNSIITVLLARTLLKAHHNLQHFAIGIVLASHELSHTLHDVSYSLHVF